MTHKGTAHVDVACSPPLLWQLIIFTVKWPQSLEITNTWQHTRMHCAHMHTNTNTHQPVISTSIAKTVSCNEKQRSSRVNWFSPMLMTAQSCYHAQTKQNSNYTRIMNRKQKCTAHAEKLMNRPPVTLTGRQSQSSTVSHRFWNGATV